MTQVGQKSNTQALVFLFYNQETFFKKQFKKYLPPEDFAVTSVHTQCEATNLDVKLLVGTDGMFTLCLV